MTTSPRRRALMHAAVVSDDGMYITGRADLRALGLRGALRWERTYDAFVAGAPAFADGRLYLALTNGRVLALDAQKGGELWSFDFKARMSAPPTVVGDVVVVGATGGTV
jgi:outer membrane protein assembly factor BamB